MAKPKRQGKRRCRECGSRKHDARNHPNPLLKPAGRIARKPTLKQPSPHAYFVVLGGGPGATITRFAKLQDALDEFAQLKNEGLGGVFYVAYEKKPVVKITATLTEEK